MMDIGQSEECKGPVTAKDPIIPLVIATVDTPHYRSRLAETRAFLSRATLDEGELSGSISTIDMLNLSDHPLIGASRILFEGWRQILLPKLLSSPDFANITAIFIAEDDLRFRDVSLRSMKDHCSAVFSSNPEIDVLSLGHAYTAAKLSRRQRRRARRQLQEEHISASSHSLFEHVNAGGRLHATTLLALRHPEGTRSLLDAMDSVPHGKRCHLDQFLFHSTLHGIRIAVSDPPLVGWAEVSQTLSPVGSGCRRNGGGRMEHVPRVSCGSVNWVIRTVEQ
jgi:hypothetical protein